MLKKIAFLLLLIVTACSKNETKNTENSKKEIPKALQDGTTIKIGRFRSNNALSEEIYQELVSNSIELKKLENELDNFNPKDTLDLFNNYDQKSDDYYSSANNQANSIRDSILKNKILSLLKNSNDKYDKSTTELNQLLKTIYQKNRDIADYHTALKIILTIPVIEKYQNDNIPQKSPFEKVIETQNSLIEKVKKNTPKY